MKNNAEFKESNDALKQQFKYAKETIIRTPIWLRDTTGMSLKQLSNATRDTERTYSSDYFENLSYQILEVCKNKDWGRDWKEGGCYLHLEVSELIESLRGKKGTPTEEFADVMFVLLGICREHNISFEKGFKELEKKLKEMKR